VKSLHLDDLRLAVGHLHRGRAKDVDRIEVAGALVRHGAALGSRAALAPSNQVSELVALDAPAQGDLSTVGQRPIGGDRHRADGFASAAERYDEEQHGPLST